MSTKDLVLKALRASKGEFISGEALSADLDVSRAAVWKAISSLRDEGYDIKAVTNRGYSLASGENDISEDRLRSFLPERYENIDIMVYDTVDSTNLKARQLAAEGAEHGTTVIAGRQTSGKGRLGRSFFSPREGIYMSIIIRPSFDLAGMPPVTAAAAVAVADAIRSVCGKDAGIKWVNDIYLDGRKICGILTEGITDFESGRIEALVIGIGINTSVKNFPKELLDTAGALEGDYSRSELAAGIIRGTLDFVAHPENSTFISSYKQKSIVIGKNIKVYKGRYNISPEDDLPAVPATALDIDNDGRLIVRYGDGSREALSSGEISIRL